MSNERLTLEEMEQKYPDEWLFIVDCEHSENTELLSGLLPLIVNPETIFMKSLGTIKAVQRYILQVNFQKVSNIYYNGTHFL